MIDLEGRKNLKHIVESVLSVWPSHEKFISRSLQDRPEDVLDLSDHISGLIRTLSSTESGGMEKLCRSYRFFCEQIVLPEELHFRRNGSYRLSSFEDAFREVYSNEPFMRRYMDGLLLSGVLWLNHSQAMHHYVKTYLPLLPSGADHLEIGPGHGLLLYFAAAQPEIGSVAAWDASPTSIENTRGALHALGVTRPVPLLLRNLFDPVDASTGKRYDSVVLGEILEHLEDPVAALRNVKQWLKPGGRIWINVPANSPSPDHIFLVTSPDHACELVREAGLEVENSSPFAMTGATLEKAARNKLSVSCVVIGRRVD